MKEKNLFDRLANDLNEARGTKDALNNVPHLSKLPETPFMLDVDNYLIIKNEENPQFSHARFNCLNESGESMPGYSISLGGLSGNIPVMDTDKEGNETFVTVKNRLGKWQFRTTALNPFNARNVESLRDTVLIAEEKPYKTSKDFSYDTEPKLKNSEKVEKIAYKITLQ